MSLSLYALIATARDRASAIEAALKYFVLGAIASGLLLYGMSMIYGISGSLDISQISSFASASTLGSQQTLILNFGLVFLSHWYCFQTWSCAFSYVGSRCISGITNFSYYVFINCAKNCRDRITDSIVN